MGAETPIIIMRVGGWRWGVGVGGATGEAGRQAGEGGKWCVRVGGKGAHERAKRRVRWEVRSS